jgi:alkylation response protein AidB-like acyl-CoA dehydrogenase
MIAAAVSEIERLSPPGEAEPPMEPIIAAMREGGILQACAPGEGAETGLAHHPENPDMLVEALAGIGGANLSAGRLFEGHVNAAKLVLLHASGARRNCWIGDLRAGRMFGVWGADGRDPVCLENGRLTGQKLFASGADVLDRAIVTARQPDGLLQMLVLPGGRLSGRLYPEEWSTTGMRATASGRCDLDGLTVSSEDMLGAPGIYEREPHFKGGVWRYAAVQLGAMRAMLAATARDLIRKNQAEAPLQSARLRRMAMACETARMWVSRAAADVERADAAPSAAATSILARLVVAEEARILLEAMDAALGAASFAMSHPVERRRRDLLFYLRQAAPDAMGEEAMSVLLGEPCLSQRWHLN